MNSPLPLILALSALAGVASATVVNIDFGTTQTFTGLAAAPDPDRVADVDWNYLTASMVGAGNSEVLNDSTGNPTMVGFEFSSLTGVTDENQSSGNGELSSGYIGLMRDYLRLDSGGSGDLASVSGKFTGLVVGGTYDLYLYGQGQYMAPSGGTNRGQNSLFTVGGVSKQTGWDGVLFGNGVLTESVSLSQQGEYVKFTAVADINGEISFSWANVVATGSTPNATEDYATNGSTPPDNTSSRFGALNGIQLVSVVPEPSTMLLGALGMLGLVVRRRR